LRLEVKPSDLGRKGVRQGERKKRGRVKCKVRPLR
jgi:hypothetical protein